MQVPIRTASILGLAVLLAAVVGCAQKKQPDMEVPRETAEAEPAPTVCTTEMAVELDQALRHLTSYYDFDKHKLARKNRKVLSKSREALNAHPPCKIFVLGHADPEGEEPYNKHLSQQRVENVVAFLESVGVDRDRIEARPYGEAYPAVDGRTLIDRARNRRVELRSHDPYAS